MFDDKNDHFTIKPISPDERHVVNNLLGRSIGRWKLAPRVHRLAASALAYREDDFKRMHFVGAFDFGSKLQGFTSIEFDANVSSRCELRLVRTPCRSRAAWAQPSCSTSSTKCCLAT